MTREARSTQARESKGQIDDSKKRKARFWGTMPKYPARAGALKFLIRIGPETMDQICDGDRDRWAAPDHENYRKRTRRRVAVYDDGG